MLVFASLLAGIFLFRRLLTDECAELPREDLSLHEIAQLYRRFDSYRADPTSPLALSARETSFLVREQFEILAWLETDGPQIHLETRLPRDGRCLNITFRGVLDVEERVPRITPMVLHLGSLDMSWLVEGREMTVPSSVVSVPGPGARELFSHLVSMQIEDGLVFVRLDDPAWLR